MSKIDYTNSIKYNYNIGSLDITNYKELANNINQYTFWDFSELSNFILHNYSKSIHKFMNLSMDINLYSFPT